MPDGFSVHDASWRQDAQPAYHIFAPSGGYPTQPDSRFPAVRDVRISRQKLLAGFLTLGKTWSILGLATLCGPSIAALSTTDNP